MATITMTHWVEIPVICTLEHIEATGDGRNEPHVPEHIELQDIEICLHQNEGIIAGDLNALKNSILDNDTEKIEFDAWEYR